MISKNGNDNNSIDTNQALNSTLGFENDAEYKLLIPQPNAAKMIGKQGKNAKLIKDEYGVRMEVPNIDAPHRIAQITGKQGKIFESMEKLLDHMPHDETKYELSFLMQYRDAGAVIGVKGNRIREIRDAMSPCEIKIGDKDNEFQPDRVVTILGSKEQVIDSLKLLFYVCNVLSSKPSKRSQDDRPRRYNNNQRNYRNPGQNNSYHQNQGDRSYGGPMPSGNPYSDYYGPYNPQSSYSNNSCGSKPRDFEMSRHEDSYSSFKPDPYQSTPYHKRNNHYDGRDKQPSYSDSFQPQGYSDYYQDQHREGQGYPAYNEPSFNEQPYPDYRSNPMNNNLMPSMNHQNGKQYRQNSGFKGSSMNQKRPYGQNQGRPKASKAKSHY